MEFNFIKIFGGGKTLLDVGLFVPDAVTNILLVFPPGDQSKEMVVEGFESWLPTAAKENTLIIAPAAPDGRMFHKGAETCIPRMLEVFFQSMEQEPRKMAIAGISNGGHSAFKLAILYPELFTKVTVVPGWPMPEDQARLENLKDLPVNIIVGGEDESWLAKAKSTQEEINKFGNCTLDIMSGGDHHVHKKLSEEQIKKIW